jgi:hypothetical protein
MLLSITAQSIFAVEPSAWARWKGILIEIIAKIKNKKNNNKNFVFYLCMGIEYGITQKKIIIFQPW